MKNTRKTVASNLKSHASEPFAVLRDSRKTVAVSGAPREEQRISFTASGPASAPFAGLKDSRKTVAVLSMPRKEQRFCFAISGHASVPFAL
jgi:hypothetical protein